MRHSSSRGSLREKVWRRRRRLFTILSATFSSAKAENLPFFFQFRRNPETRRALSSSRSCSSIFRFFPRPPFFRGSNPTKQPLLWGWWWSETLRWWWWWWAPKTSFPSSLLLWNESCGVLTVQDVTYHSLTRSRQSGKGLTCSQLGRILCHDEMGIVVWLLSPKDCYQVPQMRGVLFQKVLD